MIASGFEPVDRLEFDQHLDIGHAVGSAHVMSSNRETTGSAPGLTYCTSWGMPR
jgi:hypothetical protein